MTRVRMPMIVRAHLCEVGNVTRLARSKVNERIANAIERFRDALSDLDRELAAGWPAARGSWSARIGPAATRTLSAIREEILRPASQL